LPLGAYFVFAVLLAGCEAELDLSGVQAELQQPTQRADLFQAVSRHGDTLVVVGAMGAVVHSADGGASWQRSTLPGKPYLVDVAACQDGRFFAVDKSDAIWSAQADGSWQRLALPEGTEPQALTCDPSDTLWVIGGFSTIINSTDGGNNWDYWSMDEDLYLTTIQFVDELHGVVTGEFGTVLTTEDGGTSWTRASDLPDSFYPQSTWFTSPNNGWVVGLNGTIWATTDGAQNWEDVQAGINAPLYGVSGSGDTVVAVGDNSTILYHRIGSSDWTLIKGATRSRTYLRGVAGTGTGAFVVAGGQGNLFQVEIPDSERLASQGTHHE
jgi:photosystem II stability/assembly factor-like uncharacterized protein